MATDKAKSVGSQDGPKGNKYKAKMSDPKKVPTPKKSDKDSKWKNDQSNKDKTKKKSC